MKNVEVFLNDDEKRSHDWNKERLAILKQLMPDIFTDEGQLNIKELQQIIGTEADKESERYGFNWFGKSKAKRAAFMPTDATLIYDETQSVNPKESENLIIEGENLEVLKLLSQGYRGEIKCIYIDPPYNTGKDFVYADTWKQDKKAYWEAAEMIEDGLRIDTNMETDGRYHSNWLNMMFSRLLIARQLLREDGVIIIHIDEHEEHHLRMVLEEAFGTTNFLGNVIWDKQNPKGDAKAIGYQHEMILLFAKNKAHLQTVSDLKRKKPNASKILNKAKSLFKKVDKIGLGGVNEAFRTWLKKQNFSGGEKAYQKIDNNGAVYRGVSMAWPNKKKAPDSYFIPLIHPITQKPCPVPARGWRNPPATMKVLLEKGLILFGNDEQKQPERKYLLEENLYENIPSVIPFGGSDDALLKKWGLNFDNPKPYKFSTQFLEPFVEKEDTVLDFFGGSGTTGHAVMELNKADNGNRKFILVQLPEATSPKSEAFKAGFKKISEITIARNKQVIEEMESEKKVGFKVFRLTKSQFPKTEFAPDSTKMAIENETAFEEYLVAKEQQLLTPIKKENLITEILLKQGFQLNYQLMDKKIFKEETLFEYYSDGKKRLWISVSKKLSNTAIDYFIEQTAEKVLVLKSALNTEKKWRLQHYLGDNFITF